MQFWVWIKNFIFFRESQSLIENVVDQIKVCDFCVVKEWILVIAVSMPIVLDIGYSREYVDCFNEC